MMFSALAKIHANPVGKTMQKAGFLRRTQGFFIERPEAV